MSRIAEERKLKNPETGRESAGAVSFTLSYVHLQLLLPGTVSIVVFGVTALLFAADKHLEESGLLWILSGGRQTGGAGFGQGVFRQRHFVAFVSAATT